VRNATALATDACPGGHGGAANSQRIARDLGSARSVDLGGTMLIAAATFVLASTAWIFVSTCMLGRAATR
jgi:hypothetical protein